MRQSNETHLSQLERYIFCAVKFTFTDLISLATYRVQLIKIILNEGVPVPL